jgi:hypothetical protein
VDTVEETWRGTANRRGCGHFRFRSVVLESVRSCWWGRSAGVEGDEGGETLVIIRCHHGRLRISRRPRKRSYRRWRIGSGLGCLGRMLVVTIEVGGALMSRGTKGLLTGAELGGTTFPVSETDHPAGSPG